MTVLQINAGNYRDQFTMTLELIAYVLARQEISTPSEVQIAENLLQLMDVEINHYVKLGLPMERVYWEAIQESRKNILSKVKK